MELRIPSDVRVALGRTRFAESTVTRDKLKATNRALPLLVEWQQLTATARHNPELVQPKLDRSEGLSSGSQRLCHYRGITCWLEELMASHASHYLNRRRLTSINE